MSKKYKPSDELSLLKQWFIYTYDNEKLKGDGLLQKKIEAIQRVFDSGGIEQVIALLSEKEWLDLGIGVFNNYDRIYPVFKQLKLNEKDENKLLSEYFKGEKGYVEWLQSLDLSGYTSEQKAKFFAIIYCTTETVHYFEQELGEDKNLYWLNKEPLRFLSNCLELEYQRFMEYYQFGKAATCLRYLINNELKNVDKNIDLATIFNFIVHMCTEGDSNKYLFKEHISINELRLATLADFYEYLKSKNYDNIKMSELEEKIYGLFQSKSYLASGNDLLVNYYNRLIKDASYFIEQTLKYDDYNNYEILRFDADLRPSMQAPIEWFTNVSNEIENMSMTREDQLRIIRRALKFLINFCNYKDDDFASLMNAILEKQDDESYVIYPTLYNKIAANVNIYQGTNEIIRITDNYYDMADEQDMKGNIKYADVFRLMVKDLDARAAR